MTIRIATTVAVAAVLAGCAGVHAPATPTYAVQSSFAVPGDGRWDLLAVDDSGHRLFLSRSDRVQVIDTRDGHLIGEISGTAGVHGIALVPSLGRGFATNGRSNTVTEFDLATLARVRDLPVSGQSPDALLYDTHSKHLFIFNAKSNNASVLDPISGRELATIAFDGNPELGASDEAGHVFVNIEDRGEVVDIASDTSRVARAWKLDGCEEPTGLAFDRVHARLFSACANGVMAVTDAHDGHAVARVPIGDGPDGAEFDPVLQVALSPNGKSGNLTVVHEDDADHYSVRQVLATQVSARTIALDTATHRAYLPAARFKPRTGGAESRPEMIAGSFTVLAVGTQD
ncbi:YncE family protein [Lysobacter claricitrinus]|uniref:YncE family protein n=1 Tax=Lysobacter claricitrinus TaxID=3367728 RepID=UPI0037DADFAD